jgi:molecular chaperone DnaK
MATYVGIDLGTTNSVICSYDGSAVRLYKSPEQNDVTPSAIYIDKRGNRYVGGRAYTQSARDPDNTATLFKRFIGTNTPIKFANAERSYSPEECSAEILRTIYSYLPEEIRKADDGTVITVPAAFNQMRKDATLAAAEMAGIGAVALLQEPVAAVMSVMRTRTADGVFVIYDLGGGTLDVAIAQSIAGRVSLIAHGGIEMCGGRDMDRALRDTIVKPWLLSNFDLPETFATEAKYRNLMRFVDFAVERAKIELSQRPTTLIAESDLPFKDSSGRDIYLDVELARETLDKLIAQQIDDSIRVTRETIEKANLSPHDVERMVFVGGPTQYKPLRDRVAFELGIAASSDINPMTAVAEGAAVFAEAVDWGSATRGRKTSRGTMSAGGRLNIRLNYIARTPDTKAKLAVALEGNQGGEELQIDSLDTGWSSGRVGLKSGLALEVPLGKPGENTFKLFVFDSSGAPIEIENERVVVTRTAATVDAIPASHTIRIELLEKVGGTSILENLVCEGDPLPKSGKLTLKAATSLRAGSGDALRFKLWEGDINHPISDNRPIGTFEIRGRDLENGVIAAGADLELQWQMLDSGTITCEVSVPSVGGLFQGGRNFYSRQEAQVDYGAAAKRVTEESESALGRVEEASDRVTDPNLDLARKKLEQARTLAQSDSSPEATKEADDRVQEAKKLLAKVRQSHLRDLRKSELDGVREFFDQTARELAKASEETAFDSLVATAEREIEKPAFDGYISELRGKIFTILWRQDWFVVDQFHYLAEREYLFPDAAEHASLVKAGQEAISANNVDSLRAVVGELSIRRIGSSSEADLLHSVNVLRGR